MVIQTSGEAKSFIYKLRDAREGTGGIEGTLRICGFFSNVCGIDFQINPTVTCSGAQMRHHLHTFAP